MRLDVRARADVALLGSGFLKLDGKTMCFGVSWLLDCGSSEVTVSSFVFVVSRTYVFY